MTRKLCIGIGAAALAVVLGGTAVAQPYPGGVQSGTAPQNSQALVTLIIPSVVGVNVGHNFILSPAAAGSGCWGSGAAFPMAPGAGDTTFTFAVRANSIGNNATDVSCPGAGGGQTDLADVNVFSTYATNSTLKVKLVESGFGSSPGTAMSTLVPDLFSKLSVTDGGDGCVGTKQFPVAIAANNTDYNVLTAVPKTAWVQCRQRLQLIMNTDNVAYAAGTATGKLTYTVTNP